LIVTVAGLYIAWPLRRVLKSPEADARTSSADLAARRDTLYREIADLDFDHRLGKVDDRDYETQRGVYLEEASDVLRCLDEAQVPERGGA
jgi:hypothetical protein